MAIVSILLGGISGSIAFVFSWMLFDLGVFASLVSYLAVASLTAALVLGAALRPVERGSYKQEISKHYG